MCTKVVPFFGPTCILERSCIDIGGGSAVYCSDFQPGFRGTQEFRELLQRVPRLVGKK